MEVERDTSPDVERGVWDAEAFDEELPDVLSRAKPRNNGNRFAAAGVLIFCVAMIVSTVRWRNVEKAIERNEAIIVDQAITIQTQRNEIAMNRQRLRAYGPTVLPAPVGVYAQIENVAIADDYIDRDETAHGSTRGQRIVYYARTRRADAKQREFVNSLRTLGFSVQVSQTRNTTRDANAVWFGSGVSPLAVEIASHALLRAGYKLQHIGRFEDPGGAKAKLIEIGVSSQSLNRPAITQKTLQRALREAGLPHID